MKLFLIGIVIGIAKIIPGVSGSLFAISFGIYEKLMSSISNFFKDIKNNFIFLSKLGLGILISIFLFSNLINYLLKVHYTYTMTIFVGLMIGAFPKLNRIKKFFETKYCYIVFSFSFIFIFVLPLLLNLNFDIYNQNKVYFIFMGFLDAFSTIVPGISGTALLMIFDSYELIINSLSNMFCLESMKILIPFASGFTIGIIILTKFFCVLLKKYTNLTNCAIFGFSLSSILLLLLNLFKCLKLDVLVLMLFLLGYKIGNLFSDDS